MVPPGESEGLWRPVGAAQGAAESVPEGDPGAVVAVVPLGGASVVKLMLGRTDEPALQARSKADPHVAVAEVSADDVAQEADAVHPGQGPDGRLLSEEPEEERREGCGDQQAAQGIEG